MSTELMEKLPAIQKTGMDFDSVMNEMKTIISENPNWSDNWIEFRDSEAGTMMMQLMAWISDNMTSRQDLLFNEMFIGTAQSDLNKIRHLKQIGYVPLMAHSAKVPLKISFGSPTSGKMTITPSMSGSLASRNSQIAGFTGNDINNRSNLSWEIIKMKDGKPDYLGSIYLNGGNTEYYKDSEGNDLFALQGKTMSIPETISTDDGAYIDIPDRNVASDSIQIYLNNTNECLLEVKSFISIEAMDESKPIPYMIELNEDRTYRIRFASKNIAKKERLIKSGSVVTVFYRTCDGTLGNINPGFINRTKEFTSEDGTTLRANIYNELPAVGGTDGEVLNDAVRNGPLNLITMNRAVTPSDYDIILNNNTSIFKSKTYTSSNTPEGFKSYYGRYINPQESFIFTMLNKNYKDVPTEKYNYFPWINTIKEPRINEKYIFDNGEFNNDSDLKKTMYNLIVREKGNNKDLKFNNATVIDIGGKFNSAIYNDVEKKEKNTYLKLKLSTDKTKELFFDEIKFSLFSDKEESKITTLNTTKNLVSMDDNARFLPTSESEKNDPIDVSKARFLSFVIDDILSMTKIDLWSQFDKDNMPSKAYLKWDNENGANWDDYVKDASKDAADNRYGIVQIINKSINSAIASESPKEEFSYIYNTSRQSFGIKNVSSEATIGNIDYNNTETLNLSLELKGKTYLFDLNKKDLNNQSDWGKISGFIELLNKLFIENSPVKRYENGEAVETINEDALYGYKAILLHKPDGTSDLCIINASQNLFQNPVLENISYLKDGIYHYIDDALNVQDPESEIISIFDKYQIVNYEGMFKTLASLNENGRRNFGNIPIPTKASSYDEVASFKYIKKYDDSEKIKYGRLCIKSPTVGPTSSLYFKSSIGAQDDTDFAKEILGINFDSTQKSYKVFGEKKAYLMLNDAIYMAVENEKGAIRELTPSIYQGNVIFENSCMFNEPDFSKIYSNYKLKELNRIKIGSSYENFYYSDDLLTNERIKGDVVGILGQSMKYEEKDNGKRLYRIDKDRSRLNIKFTKDIQETNSLFAIKDDLGAIPMDVVSVETASINSNFSTIGSIVIKIDNEKELTIPTDGIQNGRDFINKIKETIDELIYTNKETELSNIKSNFNSLFKLSYYDSSKVIINSLSNNNGKVSFYYGNPETENYEFVKIFFKNFFGTSITNKDLYKLYPKEMFEKDFIIEEEDGSYYYCPTKDKYIEFTFRKLIKGPNDEEISRGADYFIDIEEDYGENKVNYNFYLVKPEGSKFPDSYFYMHFVNDKTYDFDESGEKVKETDESILQNYMYKYKVSGTDITFLQPYFKTYDIAATIYYSSNYSEDDVKERVTNAVNDLCGLKNAQIAGSMSRSKIDYVINSCDGVNDCDITFFGYDIMNPDGDSKKLVAGFFELILIHETTREGKGLKLRLVAQ